MKIRIERGKKHETIWLYIEYSSDNVTGYECYLNSWFPYIHINKFKLIKK